MKHSRESALLASIVALGLVVRICAMLGRGLIDDEVAIALALEGSYGELLRRFGGQVTQPLYLLLAKTSQELLGDALGTEVALRLPSLVFGVLGIVLIARLTRELFGPGPALWAALLLALHPFHQFYSQMAVGYALASTLSLGSMLAFTRLVRSGTRGNLRGNLAYALWTAGAIYCHLGCLGVVLAQVLALPFLLPGELRKSGLRVLALVVESTALGLLLYLPVVSSVMEFREQWSGVEGGLEASLIPFVLTAFAGGAGLRLYAFLAVGLVGLLVAARAPEARRYVSLLVLWPAAVLGFYLLNGAAHPPWAFARFSFVAVPAVVIAAALGADALWRTLRSADTGWRRAPAAALLMLLALTLPTRTAEVAWGDKGTPWPDVIAHLQTEVPQDALLVSMEMRFNALRGYYHARASDVPEDLFSFRNVLDGEPLDRPLVFVVDLAPFDAGDAGDDPAWDPALTLTRFGHTTIVFRASGPTTKQQGLRDFETVTREVLRFINAQPDPADWIYWKTDAQHQSLFDKRRLNRQYSQILESAIQRRLGGPKPEREFKIQDPYPSFWGLLAPHFSWR